MGLDCLATPIVGCSHLPTLAEFGQSQGCPIPNCAGFKLMRREVTGDIAETFFSIIEAPAEGAAATPVVEDVYAGVE